MNTQIFSVSLPRSGHHYFIGLLASCAGPIDYCFRRSQCCGEIPCSRPLKPLFVHKSHDPDLKLAKNRPVFYMIQHREPVGHILSYLENLRIKRGEAFRIDDENFAARWLQLHAAYYAGFIRKRVRDPPSGAFVLDYADLCADPIYALHGFLQAIGQEVDEARLVAAIEINRSLKGPRVRPSELHNQSAVGFLTTDQLGWTGRMPHSPRNETATGLTNLFCALVEEELAKSPHAKSEGVCAPPGG